MASVEEANRTIREAVAARMAATPADDPKLEGYRPHPLAGCQPAQAAAAAVLAEVWREPEAGCTACEGSPFVAKARTLESAQRATAEAEPVTLANLPAEFAERIRGLEIKPAVPTAEAEFRIERIGGTMNPQQLEAAWAGIKARRDETMARIRGEVEPIETVEIKPAAQRTGFRLIGLTGPAGCGKNLVAGMVPEAEVFGLADPLYAGLSAMLGIPEADLRRRATKELPRFVGKSPRELLQTLGTEWGRKLVAEDMWVRIADQRLDRLEYDDTPAVIADVRFDNEAEWIRERGGEVWLVQREPDGPTHAHVSESGISPHLIDRVIDNTGTPDQTRRHVLAALAGSQLDARTMVGEGQRP